MRNEEVEIVRYIGQRVVRYEDTGISKRPMMFYLEDVKGYEVNDDPEFEELGNVTSVYMYNGDGLNIVSSFQQFQKRHDKFIDYMNKKANLITMGLKNN